MSKKQRRYTHQELEAMTVLVRIRLSQVLFYFLLGIILITLGAIFYSVFTGRGRTELIIGLVGGNGMIAWAIKHITGFLFPNPNNMGRNEAQLLTMKSSSIQD